MSTTIRVVDSSGAPLIAANGVVCTITVGGPNVRGALRLPDGPRVDITGRPRQARVGRQPTAVELEPLVDWVRAWTGFNYHGTPVVCARSTVRAVLTQSPVIRRQIRSAMRDLRLLGER